MSISANPYSILLTDDRETVFEKIRTYAYSGGQSSVEAHRKHGGNPEGDVSYQFLYYFLMRGMNRWSDLLTSTKMGRY